MKDLRDFYEKLEHVDEGSFQHHVENGDFAAWVKDVFGEYHLSRNIRRAETREEMLRHVFIRLFT